ncbi:MAG: ABC transporter substrate binding protein [Eubacteriaceae bacterium]|nr:ABC transporter substrate binding protein [Eubacteriaceae bacterium]
MIVKRVIYILLTAVLFFAGIAPCCAADSSNSPDTPHVLFLSSYSYEWESIPKQLDGISDTLDGHARTDYVFMNTKRLAYEDVKYDIYEDILSRTETEPFDYVIAGDDAALHFVMEYRDELFSDIPVVFEGIDNEAFAAESAKEPLVTGIVETFPLNDTIRLAKKIDPDAKKVVGIVDGTISGQGSSKQFFDCEKDFPELDFSTINCSKLSKKDIGKKVSACSSDTILIYLLMTTDSSGDKYSTTDAVKYISSHADIPVYQAAEIGMGSGLLGGVVVSYRDMAADAAKIVLKVNAGSDISKIGMRTAKNYCIFDKKVMDRYNISKNDVSDDYSGSIRYLNDTPSFFSVHKSVILPLGAIIILLVLLLLFGIFIIRSRKRYTKKLTEKDRLLNNILNNMPGGVMIFRVRKALDEDIRAVYFSKGIPKLSGRTEEEYRELIKGSIFNCIIGNNDIDRMRKVAAKNVREKKPVNMRFHQLHTNGSIVWIAMSAVWRYDEKDGSSIYYAVFLDVTQQEKARIAERGALDARASNEAKSEFLSRMSHDIRTPLNAVLGFSSLALNEPGLPEAAADYLKKIDVSGNYLLALVNDVLDMAKIESGKMELHDESTNGPQLLDSITRVYKEQAAEKGITLVTDFSRSKTEWIVMDALHTHQIYANLLSNAIKFSKSGSKIEWTVIDTPAGPDTIHVVSTISDNGCGMSEDFMKKMFVPFEQGTPSDSASGTGLGLSIVKNLLSLMGGQDTR